MFSVVTTSPFEEKYLEKRKILLVDSWFTIIFRSLSETPDIQIKSTGYQTIKIAPMIPLFLLSRAVAWIAMRPRQTLFLLFLCFVFFIPYHRVRTAPFALRVSYFQINSRRAKNIDYFFYRPFGWRTHYRGYSFVSTIACDFFTFAFKNSSDVPQLFADFSLRAV